MLLVDAGAQLVRDEQHVLRSTRHVRVSENWRAWNINHGRFAQEKVK